MIDNSVYNTVYARALPGARTRVREARKAHGLGPDDYFHDDARCEASDKLVDDLMDDHRNDTIECAELSDIAWAAVAEVSRFCGTCEEYDCDTAHPMKGDA